MNFILGFLSERFGRWIDGFVHDLRIEAATGYVAGVRKARQAFIALLASLLLLLLMMSGFLLIHVALFLWVPWSLPAKAVVLLVLGAIYLGGGLIAVWRLSSDRAWIRFAKVDRILASIVPRR
jgi:uncharacterized integral membrane protein